MIKFLALVAFLSGCVFAQRGSFQSASNMPLCAGQGNYCIDDRDCCSKACNANSHKCIINANLLTSKPLENRFGDDGKPQSPHLCQQVGSKCQAGRECCSGECLTSSQKCVKNNRIPTTNEVINSSENSSGSEGQSVASGTTCSQENQQCSEARGCCVFLSCERSVCRDKAVLVQGTETVGFTPSNNLPNRFGEEDDKPQVVTAQQPTKCAEIGSKCYKTSECCPNLKCHGFLHQCVT